MNDDFILPEETPRKERRREMREARDAFNFYNCIPLIIASAIILGATAAFILLS